jgi:DNA-binding IclR family transcriptional regulator
MKEPPTDPIRRVFYLIPVVGEFRCNWFTLTDFVERARLPQATCRRYLKAFMDEGLLEKSEQTKVVTYRRKQPG